MAMCGGVLHNSVYRSAPFGLPVLKGLALWLQPKGVDVLDGVVQARAQPSQRSIAFLHSDRHTSTPAHANTRR